MKWRDLIRKWRQEGYYRGRTHGILIGLALGAVIMWLCVGCATDTAVLAASKARVDATVPCAAAQASHKIVADNLPAIADSVRTDPRPAAVHVTALLPPTEKALAEEGVHLKNTMDAIQGNAVVDKAVDAQLVTAKQTIVKRDKTIAAAKARSPWLTTLYVTTIGVSFLACLSAALGLALGASVTWLKWAKPIAGWLAIGGGIGMIGGYTMLEYDKYFAPVGLGLLAVGIIAALWINRAPLLAKVKTYEAAIPQLIKTAQGFATVQPGDVAGLKNVVAQAQSPETSALVDAVKAADPNMVSLAAIPQPAAPIPPVAPAVLP